MTLQKQKPLRSKKLRDSAMGEDCTYNSIMCNFNPETVVLCHDNQIEHGKGMGLKGDDRHAFYACSACHFFHDVDTSASKEVKRKFSDRAKARTHERMIAKGLGHILDKGSK